MRFSASKNTIIILIVCLVALIVAALTIFFNKAILNGLKYGAWFETDKYSELLEDCKYEKKEDSVVLRCEGLLTFVLKETIDSDSCFKFSLLSNQPKSELKDFTICESDSYFRWVNPYDNYDKKIPVYLDIRYKKDKKILNYRLEDITVSVIPNREVRALLSSRKELDKHNSEILLDTQYFLKKYGYFRDFERFSKELPLGVIQLRNYILKNVQIEDNQIVLIFEGELNSIRGDIRIASGQVREIYLDDNGIQSFKSFNQDNWMNLEKNVPYNLNFFALGEIYGKEVISEVIKEKVCTYTEKDFKMEMDILCTHLEKNGYSDYVLTEDIDTYISSSFKEGVVNSLDKLIFTGFVKSYDSE